MMDTRKPVTITVPILTEEPTVPGTYLFCGIPSDDGGLRAVRERPTGERGVSAAAGWLLATIGRALVPASLQADIVRWGPWGKITNERGPE